MKKEKQMYGCMEVWRDGNDNSKRRWIATQPAVARNDGHSSVIPECLCRESVGRRYSSGFTLVELVIVIAIVIILSVVSVPIYRGYTRNAKMSEGYALLGTILSAQKTYYAQYGYFLHSKDSSGKSANFGYTCNDEVLGINAMGNKYFTFFNIANRDNTIDAINSFAAYVIKPPELRSGDGTSEIQLKFNISTGSTFREDVV